MAYNTLDITIDTVKTANVETSLPLATKSGWTLSFDNLHLERNVAGFPFSIGFVIPEIGQLWPRLMRVS